jgi:hypothetical protein
MGACITIDGVAASRATSGSNLGITGAQAFSFGCWVYFNNPKSGDFDIALHYDTASGADPAFGHDTLGNFYFATTFANSQSSFVERFRWYHMVQTYDGVSTHNFYIDGALSGTRSSDTYDLGNGPLRLGSFGASTSTMNGRIDEAFVLTLNLNLAQVQDIYYRGLYPAATTVMYFCNEGSGTTIADSSGAANTATFNGGMGWSTDVPYQIRSATSSRSAASGRTQIS